MFPKRHLLGLKEPTFLVQNFQGYRALEAAGAPPAVFPGGAQNLRRDLRAFQFQLHTGHGDAQTVLYNPGEAVLFTATQAPREQQRKEQHNCDARSPLHKKSPLAFC